MISFIKGKNLSKPTWPYVKNELPPKSNNWLCHPLQQQLQAFAITANESFTSLWRNFGPLFFAELF